jgi:phosphatidylglycerol lysyltransferase
MDWSRKKTLIKRMGPFFGLGLFGVAAVVLYHQLHAYRLHDILYWIQAIPAGQTWTAVLLTACSYLIMTGYDLLALQYVRHSLEMGKTALASFLGFTFSNTIGLSLIAGASVRYRLYSAWGLSATEITQVVLFCTSSLWLGFCTLSGAVFVAEPMALPHSLLWPVRTVRPLGLLLLALAALYFGATLVGRRVLTLKGWRLTLPSFRLAGAQVIIASADWLMAGCVLYVLLPQNTPLGFGHFLEIFLLAQLAGLVSQVPGGLGIFETGFILLLPATIAAPQVLGALLVYRGIYYLLPLMAAVVALGVEELLRQRALITKIQSLTGSALEALFIPLLSLAVFVGGAILMFSGALPSIPQRLAYLKEILPLLFLELSHFLGSLAGMGLLLLARGLQLRLDAAYLLTAGLLVCGIVVSLLKGVDYEEASFLALILAVLLPCRKLFFRRTSLLSERFTPGWLAAIAIVLISSISLGLFAFRHVEYRHELWWHFSVQAEAPRFLRATVGALALALGFGLARLLRPAPYHPPQAVEAWPEAVPAIVRQSPAAAANLALLGDKQFILSENRQAFIMYGVSGQTWVAMGDPVGPVEQWSDLLWQFRGLADDYADRAVYYEVSHEHLHLYLDMGLTLLKLGEEARVPLSGFTLEGSARKNLRYIHRKLEKQGCSFEMVPAQSVPVHLTALQAVSDEWLQERNTREKGFSLGFFDPGYIRHFPVGMVRFQGSIVAFANIWSSAGQEELTVDMMRHRSDAPNGIMDFLFIELMLWGSAQGYEWFNLGMAPLSGMETHEPAPLWHRIGGLVVRFGDHFYNFQGLRAYKQKFAPVWHPRYLATPGGLSLPRTLTDIGALISGSVKGILFK